VSGDQFNKIFTKVVHLRGMAQFRAPSLFDPLAVPRDERLAHYRRLAARYTDLAEKEDRPFIRGGLLDLAQQCACIAGALAVVS
jgi:hypothetical protein